MKTTKIYMMMFALMLCFSLFSCGGSGGEGSTSAGTTVTGQLQASYINGAKICVNDNTLGTAAENCDLTRNQGNFALTNAVGKNLAVLLDTVLIGIMPAEQVFGTTIITPTAMSGGNTDKSQRITAIFHQAGSTTDNQTYDMSAIKTRDIDTTDLSAFVAGSTDTISIGAMTVVHSVSLYTLSGKVTDAYGGGLSGVNISITGATATATTTGSNGTYSSAGLQNSNYTITPSLAGYTFTPANIPVLINDANSMGINFTASSSLPAGGEDRVLASVTLSGGNGQTATVGKELSEPIVATLLNRTGLPISGLVVDFKVVTGGGNVFAGSAISDTIGIVRERWTLGTGAGLQQVEVRAADSTGANAVFATFNATAVADTPASMSIVSGASQSGTQLQTLPLPVKVIVKDAYGNPAAGITVTFTAHNGGSIVPVSATTSATGEAIASWTLGLPIGQQTLWADVTGLTRISFYATATPAPPSEAVAIRIVSGDAQTVVQHSILPIPLRVSVTDVLGNGVPGIQVIFSAVAGSGYIPPKTAITDSGGSASWTGYIHTAGQLQVDAYVSGVIAATFTTNITPSSHPYDGAYLCLFTNHIRTSDSFTIVAGNVTDQTRYGMLSEVNGNFSIRLRLNSANSDNMSGYLIIDSLQRATGSGVITKTGSDITGIINGNTGAWTCERQ